MQVSMQRQLSVLFRNGTLDGARLSDLILYLRIGTRAEQDPVTVHQKPSSLDVS